MTTEERLVKLERKIEEMQAEIYTKKLCVLDDQGQERITLDADNNEPMLIMFDTTGNPRALMTVIEDESRQGMRRIMNANGKTALLHHIFQDGAGLILFDANGKHRAYLNIDKTGPILSLDPDEFASATLRVSKDKPELLLNMFVKGTFLDQSSQAQLCVDKTGALLDMSDATGKSRAMMRVNKDGPMLNMLDDKEDSRASLAVTENDPWLIMKDENGKTRAEMVVAQDQSRLVVMGENGKTRSALTVDRDVPGLYMRDENGKLRAQINVDKDQSRLDMFDENGKPIWKAP